LDYSTFISSGILEQYVLGLASVQEVQQVNNMLLKYPELKVEIEAIEDALISQASANAPDLNADLKKKIQQQIITNNQTEKQTTQQFEAKKPVVTYYQYAVAASVATLVVSLFYNFSLYNKLENATTELAIINAEKTTLATQFQVLQTSVTDKQNQLAAVVSADNKMVTLKGVGKTPNMVAHIYWNNATHQVAITTHDFEILTSGKQYQLWAIVDGKPIDMGVFDSSVEAQIKTMKSIAAASAFAVTIENKGGSINPTLETMVVLGNI
jgi:anti-sigma-K factor RskA